ncbi:MAG: hypothetical protein LBJ88_05415 [Campylobacteraceae bacterium]|jgi:uncharacterized protein YecT (DUF1311 family)|nr:hypothetical protein [Campylobacteraceae bacterium]
MKPIVKLLIFLIFCFQYVNASPNWFLRYEPTECSLSLYIGESKCIKLVYQEVDERLDRSYKNISKYVSENRTVQLTKEYNFLLRIKNEFCARHPEKMGPCKEAEEMLDKEYKNVLKNIDAVKLIKKYPLWIEMRDEFCSMYSDNQTKLQLCHIDLGIDKLHEFWNMEWEIDSIPYFEGKWLSCGQNYHDDGISCALSFFVEQNGKICGAWRSMGIDYISGIRARFIKVKEDGMAYTDIGCYDGHSSDNACSIYTIGNNSKRLNKEQLDSNVSNWQSYDYYDVVFGQYYYGKDFFWRSNIKTPFLPNEKEKLIEDNKWLQDCLKKDEGK